MVEVLAIDDLDEFAGYRMLWNSWQANTPRATFFHTWDWLETYWRHFGAAERLRVLVVHSDGSPLGILPLCVRPVRYGFGTVRVLGYPLENRGMRYGPVGSNRGTTMLAAMRYLRNAQRDWDMIDLRCAAPPSSDGCRAARSMTIAGLLSQREPDHTTSSIEFEGDWNGYLASRARKTRHEIRRCLRRAFDVNGATLIRHRPAPAREGDGDPRWDLFEMCEQVARASWQGRADTGFTLSRKRSGKFLRDAHAAAAHNGMVDMNLLIVGDRPAAFAYNYHCDGRLTSVQIGYDPAVGPKGLGTALVLRTIEDSFERRDRSMDLGPDELRFQRKLRTRVERHDRLTYLPMASWRSQAVRIARWAKRRRASASESRATA
jgi:CelD/BcsL family acetyltransferase involved in cellulose biosynthesis